MAVLTDFPRGVRERGTATRGRAVAQTATPRAGAERVAEMKALEGAPGGAEGAALALRAFFVYVRRASAESELDQYGELTLFLPRRGATGILQVEGEVVPCEASSSLQLRREKSGVYVTMSSISFSGALPFEIGVRTGAEEQRWLIGELRHYEGDGEGMPGGWGLRVSTTATLAGGALAGHDIELLVCCDVAPGRPACISAHAQLPTARRTSLRSRGRRPSSLEVISEDTQARQPQASRRRCLSAPRWPAPAPEDTDLRFLPLSEIRSPQCELRGSEAAGPLGRTVGVAGDKGSQLASQDGFEWDPSAGHDEFMSSESWVNDFHGTIGAQGCHHFVGSRARSRCTLAMSRPGPAGRNHGTRGSAAASRAGISADPRGLELLGPCVSLADGVPEPCALASTSPWRVQATGMARTTSRGSLRAFGSGWAWAWASALASGSAWGFW